MDSKLRGRGPAVPGAHYETFGCRHCAVDRRLVLKGAGAVGITAFLAACGGDDGAETDSAGSGSTGAPGTDTGSPPDRGTPDDPATSETTPAEPTPAEPTPRDTEAGSTLTTTDEVPVGGGVILNRPGVVVTQPTAGRFAAFSSTCTHRGCTVTEAADGIISCPCLGSQFSVADGSVQGGPAQAPLPAVPIKVQGNQILPQ